MTWSARRVLAAMATLAIMLTTLAGCGRAPTPQATTPTPRAATGNPFTGQVMAVDRGSMAAHALANASGADARADAIIAATPQATWIMPDTHPTSTAADTVSSMIRGANGMLTLVVYGMPHRDCGADPGIGSGYVPWVNAIAAGIAGAARPVAVIMEPDTLAGVPSCRYGREQSAALATAVRVMVGSGASVYVDAGHSGWRDPGVMAGLIDKVRTPGLRGFSVNVANHDSDDVSRAYGDAVSAATGLHYVIDTSRNGAVVANHECCNAPDARLGRLPAAATGRGWLDAYLWVKRPGETDGPCNGGPATGWWQERATTLATDAVR